MLTGTQPAQQSGVVPGSRQVWAVLLVAAMPRVFAAWFVLVHQGTGWFPSQAPEMGYMANALARGDGLCSPFGPSTGPTAMFAPVYPLLLAAFFKAFGSYTPAAAAGMVAVQIFVNLLVIWLMMAVARRAFGERASLLAGLFWAVSPPLWFVPTIGWDTSVTLACLVGVMAVLLWVRRDASMSRWMTFGLYGGAMALVNPALVPTLAGMVLAVTIFCGRMEGLAAFRRVAIAVLVFGCIFGVWPLRNALVMHAFVPLRTAPGIDLWMGNHAGASGFVEPKDFPIYNHAELLKYESQGEVAYTQHKGAEARAYISDHPGVFAGLTLRRFWRFWSGTGSKDGSMLFAAHAFFTAFLGFTGLWLLVRRRRWELAVLFSVPLLLFPLPYYVTHAEFRFRLVVDPLLVLLGAYGLVEAWDIVAEKNMRGQEARGTTCRPRMRR